MSHKNPFSLFVYFGRNYPTQSAIVVFSLLVAAIAETIGIGALFPLISYLLEGGNSGGNGYLTGVLNKTFGYFGLVPDLKVLLITIVIMIVAKSVIIYTAMRYTGFVAADIARNFQLALVNALMKAQWQYFSGLSLGSVSNAVASETQRAGHSYMLAGRAVSSFIQAVVYLCVALFVSWQLSLFAILIGGIILFFAKGVLRSARNTGAELSTRTDSLLSEVNESLSGAKPLKAMALEDRFLAQIERETGEVLTARKIQYKTALLLQMIFEPIIIVSLAIGLYYILTYTSTSIPQVFVLAFLFQRLMGYITVSQSHYQNMLQNEGAVWSMLSQIEEAKNLEEKISLGERPNFEKEIAFQNGTIGYANGKNVFSNFSCSIPFGKITALFGPSGAGKTTLIDAMLGLIPLQDGALRIDGKNIDSVDIRRWREMAGYVPQDNFLFHDTIRWNITLGSERYTEAQIQSALVKAAAYDFVQSQPEGLDTVVGERGGKLSGGQRQRIILARALIREPRLLILDEPTSALDKQNEAMIFSVLGELSKSMAVILISHNEQVLSFADHVIRLENA